MRVISNTRITCCLAGHKRKPAAVLLRALRGQRDHTAGRSSP